MATKRSKKRLSFTITIIMAQSIAPNTIQRDMPYRYSNGHSDSLYISNSKIVISGDRIKEVNFKGVFSNYKSEIYSQIVKSLIYYFCVGGFICKIKSIELYNKTGEQIGEFEEGGINQLSKKFIECQFLKKIDREKLNVIFEANKKASSYYYSLSYIIRAYCINNSYDSFEKLWKAFNSIYKEVSNSEQDLAGQSKIRDLMINRPQDFPEINALVTGLTAKQIRDKVKWFEMLKNDYNTQAKTEAFKSFIIRNEDFRLMTIFDETLSFREDFLTQHGSYNLVKNHIDSHIALQTINNMHVAATLCIKYMYFIRNKSIHAEHADGAFRLFPHNKEDKSVRWCSSLLTALLIDLINSN